MTSSPKHTVLWPVLCALTFAWSLAGCTFSPPEVAPGPDGQVADAGSTDLGLPDVTPGDGATPDADIDGGVPDANIDGGVPDTGDDGGPVDGALDGGLPDADLDAGFPDTGGAPLARAGPDQLACSGDTVTLDGSPSSGDAPQFAWTQIGGDSVALTGSSSAVASFVMPNSGPLNFQLEVSNALGSSTDTTQVNLDAPPVANAGTDLVVVGNRTIQLDGSASTDDVGIASFAWTQVRGSPNVSLIDADTVSPSFTSPATPGASLVFSLEVTDDCGQSSTATVGVQVNQPPTAAHSGPYSGLAFDTIAMDASASSDPEGAPLTYSWTLAQAPIGHPGGGFPPYPGTGNASSSAVAPLFYVSIPGTYTFDLVVSDGLESDQTSVTITIGDFSLIPYGNVNREDSRALEVRPSDGDVFIATRSFGFHFRLGDGDVVELDCLASDKVNAVKIASDGRVFFGFDDDSRMTEIPGDGSCNNDQNHDSSDALNPNPGRIRDLLLAPGDDIYAMTDRDVAYYDDGISGFTQEISFPPLSGAADIGAGVIDGSGQYWFASRENPNNDGAVRVVDPLNVPANVPRLDFVAGADDRIEHLVLGAVNQTVNELWLMSRDFGAIQVPDVDDPATFTVFNINNNGLPAALANDRARRGRLDAVTEDVWLAFDGGIARYKRDVGLFVVIPNTLLGAGSGDNVYDVAFDDSPNRPRRVYIATQDGVYMATATP